MNGLKQATEKAVAGFMVDNQIERMSLLNGTSAQRAELGLCQECGEHPGDDGYHQEPNSGRWTRHKIWCRDCYERLSFLSAWLYPSNFGKAVRHGHAADNHQNDNDD